MREVGFFLFIGAALQLIRKFFIRSIPCFIIDPLKLLCQRNPGMIPHVFGKHSVVHVKFLMMSNEKIISGFREEINGTNSFSRHELTKD